MRSVQLSALAELDLDDIWRYVAAESQNFEIANKVLDGIGRRFALFRHTPDAGRRREDIEPGLRSFSVGSYNIYYRTSDVTILRVIHGSREQAAAFFENSNSDPYSSR